jgi:hypothetical protein
MVRFFALELKASAKGGPRDSAEPKLSPAPIQVLAASEIHQKIGWRQLLSRPRWRLSALGERTPWLHRCLRTGRRGYT